MKKIVRVTLTAILILAISTTVGCMPAPSNPKSTPTPAILGTFTGTYTKPGEVYKFFSWQFNSDNPYQGDDIRSRAMSKRVKDLEDGLGIDIQFVPNTGQTDTIRQSAFQGTPMVDGQKEGGLVTIMQTYLYQDVPGACIEPLSDYPEVFDFSNTNKFEVAAQKELTTFNNKLWYFIPIELGIHFECSGNALVFNKRLVSDAGITPETIYGWVDSGQWTWDKFETVLTATTKKDKGQWGMERGNQSLNIWALIQSNEGELVRLVTAPDGSKQDKFVGYEPNTIAAYDEYIKMIDDLKCVEPTFYSSVDLTPLNHFMTGKTAFMFTGYSTNSLDKIAKMADDYGIIPTPKGPVNVADKNQYTSYFPHMNPYNIFRGVQNPRGAIEILAKVFQPIYDANSDDAKQLYQTEKDLFSRDDESKKNLDIIEQNKVFVRQMSYGFAAVGDNNFTNVLYGDAEEGKLISKEITPKAYFDSITDALDAAIIANSPYTWQ